MSRVIPAFSQFFDGTGAPLANGYLKFLISGTTSADKDTYADVDQSIPNANPVQLDGEGRAPNIFGQGIYKVILYDVNPVTGLPGKMVQTFDPVVADYESSGAGGNFADWDVSTIYQIGQIVIYNGLYYRSHVANNVGNQPDTSADSWERIDFLRFWNLDVTYGLDDVVIYNSNLYFSLQTGNLNHVPNTSPTWWDPVGSGTILLNWEESGTDFIPVVDGYNIGDATNRPGTVFIRDAPTAIDHGTNKAYVDGRGTGLFNWEDIAGTLRPLVDDNDDIGDTTHRPANIFIANDPTDDDHAVKKSYVDGLGHLSNWEDIAGALRPLIDDNDDIGDTTHRPANVFIANDPTDDDHAVRRSYLSGLLYEEPIVNLITNGDFSIAQRATSQTTNGVGSIDRWNAFASGSTFTFSQEVFLPGQTDVPGGPTNYCKNIVVTGGAASDLAIVRVYIFNIYNFSNVPVILAFSAKADSSKNIATECIQNFGSGGSSAVTSIGVTTHSLSTSWGQFYALMTPPSISGLTVGALSNLQINFWCDAGSDYDSRTNSLGNQSGTFEIADVQLLYGSNAKAFQRKSFEDTLLDCLPYYQKSFDYDTAPAHDSVTGEQHIGSAFTTSILNCEAIFFNVPMVVTPTVTLYSPSEGTITDGNWAYLLGSTWTDPSSASSVVNLTTKSFQVQNDGSGFTRYSTYLMSGHWTADTGY